MAIIKSSLVLKEETASETLWREVFEVQNHETNHNFRLEMKLSNDTTKFLSLIAEDRYTAQREASRLMQKLANELHLERAFWRFSGSNDWKFISSHSHKNVKHANRSKLKLQTSFKNIKDKVIDFFFVEED